MKSFVFLLIALAVAAWAAPCMVSVTEKGTGWPVAMVQLRTTHNVTFVSDNAGMIALDVPELFGRETWFFIEGHGYEVPKDGFGYQGVRLTPEAGKTLKVEVERKVLAKRLGRLTGAGLFAEAQKGGQHLDWKDQGVFGCDSVQNAVHDGKLFWLWGDTTLAHYPLAIFHGSSATTAVRPLSTFEPPLRLAFDYFRKEDGKPRDVAKMPGDGPTWVSGYVSVPDAAGKARLVGTYSKIRGFLDAYEVGLCVWNETTANFELFKVLWKKSDGAEKPPFPDGHPVLWKDAQGESWLLFGNPLPTLKMRPSFEAWGDPSKWEVLKPQATLKAPDGSEVKPHSGSICWSAHRKRWVTVFMEALGKPSAFGELWYAEAPAPQGPWGTAVKILTHNNYTFYNPRIHPEMVPEDSPILLFEGTYTKEFANHAVPTPRFDYNQILYRLDLDDPGLAPAKQSP